MFTLCHSVIPAAAAASTVVPPTDPPPPATAPFGMLYLFE